MPKPIGTGIKVVRTVGKRTSQGLRHKPKNKNARRHWKRYVGQGRV